MRQTLIHGARHSAVSESVTLHKYASTAQTFSDSKIKEGIFVGLQIRALIRDGKFEDLLSQI
jgi:hypothetical protein